MAHLCFNKMRCPKHSAAAKAAFLSKLQQRLHFQTGMAVYREKKKKKKRIHTCLNFYCLTVSTCTEDVGRVQGEKKIYSVPLVKSAECEWHFRNCLPCPDILYTILYISV